MRGRRADLIPGAVLAAAALLPRLVLLIFIPERPLMADMVDYYDRALYLYEEGTLYPGAFRVPGFSVTLAGAFTLLGPGIHAARVLQCTILVLLAGATFVLARSAMSSRRALVAGLIVAWYPGLLLYTTYVMAEPLYALLVVCALIAVGYGHGCRLWTLLIAGGVAGLATLTRQAGVGLIAALVIWTGWPFRGSSVQTYKWRRIAFAAPVIIGAVIALSPWVIRNSKQYGEWMPLESTGGITFLIAQYEGATGRYFISDWDVVHDRYFRDGANEFATNAMAYRLGFEKIKEDPWRIAQLIPRRIGYLFDLEEREHTWVYSHGFWGEHDELVVRAAGWLLLLSFPLLTLGAVVSIFFSSIPYDRTTRLVLVVLAVMLLQHGSLFGDPRFHLPFVPLLTVVALRPGRAEGRAPSTASKIAGAMVIVAALAWWTLRLPAHAERLSTVARPGGWNAAIVY